MVKINDTTSFPNTAPALSDHVPGTDVSNTANSADGETVTFLMSAIATLLADTSVTGMPINEAAWHPYDAVTVGDGNDGVLWDDTVSAQTVSFTPEAGYDYRLVIERVGHNSASNQNMQLRVTGTSTAQTSFDVYTTVPLNGKVDAFVELFAPADLTTLKQAAFASGLNMSAGSFTDTGIEQRVLRYSTEEAAATVELGWTNSRGLDGGKIWLLRRRNYQKG